MYSGGSSACTFAGQQRDRSEFSAKHIDGFLSASGILILLADYFWLSSVTVTILRFSCFFFILWRITIYTVLTNKKQHIFEIKRQIHKLNNKVGALDPSPLISLLFKMITLHFLFQFPLSLCCLLSSTSNSFLYITLSLWLQLINVKGSWLV